MVWSNGGSISHPDPASTRPRPDRSLLYALLGLSGPLFVIGCLSFALALGRNGGFVGAAIGQLWVAVSLVLSIIALVAAARARTRGTRHRTANGIAIAIAIAAVVLCLTDLGCLAYLAWIVDRLAAQHS
jgi:hypothetical protein